MELNDGSIHIIYITLASRRLSGTRTSEHGNACDICMVVHMVRYLTDSVTILTSKRRPRGPWLPLPVGDKDDVTLPDFVFRALNSQSPTTIGLAVLCVTVCLQQLDTTIHQYIIRQLPHAPGVLFQEYFDRVDRLVLTDYDYAGTQNGIELLMLAAKIYSM